MKNSIMQHANEIAKMENRIYLRHRTDIMDVLKLIRDKTHNAVHCRYYENENYIMPEDIIKQVQDLVHKMDEELAHNVVNKYVIEKPPVPQSIEHGQLSTSGKILRRLKTLW